MRETNAGSTQGAVLSSPRAVARLHRVHQLLKFGERRSRQAICRKVELEETQQAKVRRLELCDDFLDGRRQEIDGERHAEHDGGVLHGRASQLDASQRSKEDCASQVWCVGEGVKRSCALRSGGKDARHLPSRARTD